MPSKILDGDLSPIFNASYEEEDLPRRSRPPRSGSRRADRPLLVLAADSASIRPAAAAVTPSRTIPFGLRQKVAFSGFRPWTM